MTALATRSPVSASSGRPQLTLAAPKNRPAPIIAAIDGSSASQHAIDAAVRLAVELNAPLMFVYVRRGPPGFLGTPVFQRRLTAKMAQARRVSIALSVPPRAPASRPRVRSSRARRATGSSSSPTIAPRG